MEDDWIFLLKGWVGLEDDWILFPFLGANFLFICSRGKVAARFEECNFPGVIGFFL